MDRVARPGQRARSERCGSFVATQKYLLIGSSFEISNDAKADVVCEVVEMYPLLSNKRERRLPDVDGLFEYCRRPKGVVRVQGAAARQDRWAQSTPAALRMCGR
jgi:hypothetical protein